MTDLTAQASAGCRPQAAKCLEFVDGKRYICRIRHMQARSLSYAATAVLEAVAQGHQYGFDVIAVTGLASGTVYPALRRLEDAGYVESRWEDQRLAQREVRPVRKYYEVTEPGQAALAAALLRYRGLGRRRRSARVLRPSRA
jgi:PadR family transcriptional regulator PadR